MTTNKFTRGFGIQTHGGHTFDPKSRVISQIDIFDVSHALSNLCRFAGHCRSFYSVAEHSVLVANIIEKFWPDDHAAIRAGFFHDATEAYVVDLPTPIKVLLPDYTDIEDKIATDIESEFQVEFGSEIATKVKFADMVALATEARYLFDDVSHWESIKSFTPVPELLAKGFPLPPEEAKKYFMRKYIALEKQRMNS